MFIRRFKANRFVYMTEADDGSQGGGAGGAPDVEDQQSDQKPSDREAELLKEVMQKKEKINSLTEAQQALQNQLDEQQANLKKLEGVDPELFQTLLKEREEAKERELEGNKDWKTLKEQLLERFESEKQQMREQHQAAIEEASKPILEEKQTLEVSLNQANSLIEEMTIGTAFKTSEFVTNKLIPSPAKIRKLYGEHFDVENNTITAFDKPRGAEKRQPLVDADGKPLKFEMALAKIVDLDPDKDTILRAAEHQGAGSDTQGRQGGSQAVQKGMARIKAGLNKQS